MYEVDFLPVENENQNGGKSGDAITVRFTVEAERRTAVLIIDGGRQYTSEQLAEHVEQHYQTRHIDLMISTHPDADHLDGLAGVLALLTVGELMIHQPALHTADVSDVSNLESIEKLLAAARANHVTLSEPFTGTTRFGGQLSILGPTQQYYRALVEQQIREVRAAAFSSLTRESLFQKGANLLEHQAFVLPAETLTDDGQTSARNNSSAITLLTVGDKRMLFTGDAGIEALEAAADYHERRYGTFAALPLSLLQAPHHGSRRNLGPSILNRLIGSPLAPHPAPRTAHRPDQLGESGSETPVAEGGQRAGPPWLLRRGHRGAHPVPPQLRRAAAAGLGSGAGAARARGGRR